MKPIPSRARQTRLPQTSGRTVRIKSPRDCAHPVSIVTSQRTVHGHGGSVCGFPTCIGSCALLQRRNERANDGEGLTMVCR